MLDDFNENVDTKVSFNTTKGNKNLDETSNNNNWTAEVNFVCQKPVKSTGLSYYRIRKYISPAGKNIKQYTKRLDT
jgi:hypothetical protein